jgi:HD-GYP domain-containing protein (c-di-GMP phosphodiesterase class II)
MDDIKKEQIAVERLMLGMYVAELDRPWAGTPFMLQGFLLDDQKDLDQILTLCKFVYIDRSRSIGNQFAAAAKLDVAFKREGAVFRIKDPGKIQSDNKITAAGQKKFTEKTSFIDILRDLKNYQAPQNIAPNSQDGVMYNVKHGANTAAQAAFPYQTQQANSNNVKPITKQLPITKQIAEDVSDGITGFFGSLFRKREKLSTSTDPITESKKNKNEDDGYRVIIYEEEAPVENEIAAIYPIYEQSQIATREIFNSVANQHDLDLTAVSDILDNMVESIGRSPDALLWLAKLKQADDYSYSHALNVSITLMAFGNFLALSKKQIKEIGLAGLLQDVGKVKLSSDVLLKEGKLSREEFDYVKKHVDESLKILENTPDIPNTVIFLVAQHHERIDGSGYPYGSKGSQIGLLSQTAGLIDTYCAITSHKCYAKGVYHQEALEKIHELSGKQFSSELVDQLVQFMGMYPVSSLVELNTGEVGVVIQQNQVRRLLPRLMLLLDPDKVRYEAPVIVNLLNSPICPNGDIYKITKSLPPDSYGLNPSDFYV